VTRKKVRTWAWELRVRQLGNLVGMAALVEDAGEHEEAPVATPWPA